MSSFVTVLDDVGLPPPWGGEIEVDDGRIPIDTVTTFDPHALDDASLMVAVTLIDPTGQVAVDGPPAFGGEIDWPNVQGINILGSSKKYWLAANIGITTKPEDTPSNMPVPPALVGKVPYGDSLFSDIDPFQGNQPSVQQAGRGMINLLDTSGRLYDSMVNLSWDGALLEIYRGRSTDLRANWTKIASMTTSGVLYDSTTKSLRIRDASWKLEAEIQPARYGGTGGIDGDASIRGVTKPYGIGWVENAPLQTINATLLIGQLSNSSIFSVNDLRDGGQSLAFSADYPSYDTLAAAVIANGFYATCLARGLIRLGALPTKQLTADFCGDNDLLSGKRRPMTRADIVRRIACGLGFVRFDQTADIDAQSFAQLDNNYTAELGYFWNQPISKGDAIREVMSGLSGYAAVRFDGKLIAGAAELPTGAPFSTLTFGRDFKSSPKMISYSPPRYATYIGWGRNYTQQTRDQLQTGVPEAQALIYSQPTQAEQAASLANGDIWPTSQIITIDGGFHLQADAVREATRQQSIFGVRRERWQVEVPMDQFAPILGRGTTMTGWPRYGFDNGRQGRCVAIQAQDQLNLTLDLWM